MIPQRWKSTKCLTNRNLQTNLGILWLSIPGCSLIRILKRSTSLQSWGNQCSIRTINNTLKRDSPIIMSRSLSPSNSWLSMKVIIAIYIHTYCKKKHREILVFLKTKCRDVYLNNYLHNFLNSHIHLCTRCHWS